jgi:transcription elongation factor GreA
MIEITKRVATARDLGDLSENAEYHAAREDQGLLQAKIDSLKDQLSRATIIDKNTLPTGFIAFGSRVKVMDLDMDEEETFELVGPGQENPDANRIPRPARSPRGCSARKRARWPRSRCPVVCYGSRYSTSPSPTCDGTPDGRRSGVDGIGGRGY